MKEGRYDAADGIKTSRCLSCLEMKKVSKPVLIEIFTKKRNIEID